MSAQSADTSSSDQTTTLEQLRQVVRQFVDERDWRQFHSPKNLSMALSVEASELMEIFQWVEPIVSRDVDAMNKRREVEEELSDVLCYALAIANELDIDLASAFQAKMQKNRTKYPAAEFRGRYGKDDPGPLS
jgi:NTP pyrophosphatase (non-canonical NTP hydrolase)